MTDLDHYTEQTALLVASMAHGLRKQDGGYIQAIGECVSRGERVWAGDPADLHLREAISTLRTLANQLAFAHCAMVQEAGLKVVPTIQQTARL